jgi:tetratricopeptide (TPR) repeat protein
VIALAKTGDRRAVDRMYEMVTSDSDHGVAEQAWTALVTVADSDATLILPLATKLQDSGRFPKAETLLKTLADSTGNGDDVMEARRRLAKGYLAAGNYQAARIYFQRILDARPDDAEAVAGVTAALKNVDDLAGLAAVSAREIASGKAGAEVKASFVEVLGRLLERPNYAAVVQAAQQALAGANGLDQQYAVTVKDVEAKALPGYLKTLVDALSDPQDAAQLAAREALAGYGRVASQALVDGLESASGGTRSVCLELLMALADGKSFGFDAKKPASQQQDALSQWRMWLVTATAQK